MEEKKKRKRPDSTAQPKPGENAKFLTHSIKLAALPQVNMKDAEQVEARIGEYFRICIEDDAKPSITGLSLAFGIDRRRMWDFREGRRGDLPQANRDMLKKADLIIENQMVQYMQNGSIQPVAGIFLLKACHGYKEEQTLVVEKRDVLEFSKSQEQLFEAYGIYKTLPDATGSSALNENAKVTEDTTET